MPQLVMQNLGLPTVVLEDPRGVTEFVVSIGQNEIRSVEVTTDQLERLVPHLQALEAETQPDFRWSVIMPPDTGSTVRQTTGALALFVDSVTGDDTHDGLSAATARKTLAAIMGLIPPIVRHTVVIHMRGVFEDPGDVHVSCYIAPGVFVILDGGSDFEVLAGPFTATASAEGFLQVVGAGWTPNAYQGYWLEVRDGPEMGALRLIQCHDADTLVVSKAFDFDPGLCSFRMVRPQTEFKASGVLSGFYLSGCYGGGRLALQRLYVSGTQAFVAATHMQAEVQLSQCIIDSSWATQGFLAENCETVQLFEGFIDPLALVVDRSSGIGVSVRQAPVYMVACNRVALWGSVCDSVVLQRCGLGVSSGGIRRGSWFKQVTGASVKGNSDSDWTVAQISSESGYAPVRIVGSAGSGLQLTESTVIVGDNVVIDAHAAHGVVLERSQLILRGTVSGTNGGAGVYAYSQSTVLIKDGSPPTLTGGVGDVSVDGTTLGTRWNSVAFGSPFVDVPELTLVKEVP